MRRRLIVNADDFGLSQGVNRGIIEAHRDGIVTSASLMVRWPAATAAAELSRANPALGIGLHVDLGEWYWTDGDWPARYEVVDLTDPAAVSAEVEAQVTRFQDLMRRPPTHIDSHQHVHHDPVIRPMLVGLGERFGIPIRAVPRRDGTEPIRYCGEFYGQDGRGYPVPEAITAEALVRIIDALPDGTTEIACHAGYGDDLNTTYADERALEVRALCDPRVRVAIEANGIDLCTFAGQGAGANDSVATTWGNHPTTPSASAEPAGERLGPPHR